MKPKTVAGVIDWKILINYKVELNVLRQYLPQPFFPKAIRGYGLVSIVLCKQKQLRPSGLPLPLGLNSVIVTHEVAVYWEELGQLRQGVYIPRRDTSSLLQVLMGDRLSGGIHHLSHIRSKVRKEQFTLSMRSRDDQAIEVRLMAQKTPRFPMGSIMKDLPTAVGFWDNALTSYSPRYEDKIFDQVELVPVHATLHPLRVQRLSANYWGEVAGFPAGSIFFDHALLVQRVKQTWHHKPEMIRSRAIQLPSNKEILIRE